MRLSSKQRSLRPERSAAPFTEPSAPARKFLPMTKSVTTLDDKYIQTGGRVFISSNQALVRLPLDQKRRDRAAGLKTAGYISGYRGSPLGVYDSALWAAQKLLDCARHSFRTGPERRVGGQRDSRHATAEVVRSIEVRWRLRPVVRQGHRRRSRLRIIEARQSRGHRPRTAAFSPSQATIMAASPPIARINPNTR